MEIIDANPILAKPSAKVLAFKSSDEHPVLGRIGNLETRLAANLDEIEAAQSLRYKVFVDEMGANLPIGAMITKRDFDQFDGICDHLLVFERDPASPNFNQVVGTYRLMRQHIAEQNFGFYSQNEYDVASLVNKHKDLNFVELGRSCVLPEYRTRRSIELLWQGIWSYVRQNQIDVMFGCASFPGTIPAAHTQAMSFLYHYSQAGEEWSVEASGNSVYSMDLMPKEGISVRSAFSSLPPLIKGYLRLGAMVSPDAVIDREFNTSDVLIVLPVSQIKGRYQNYYTTDIS